MKKMISLLIITLLALGIVGGCAPKADSTGAQTGKESTTSEGKEASSEKKLKVVLVVTGQLGDKSFYDSAANGIKMIAAQTPTETKIIEIGRDQSKWEPTFMDLADSEEYDIIITNGSSAKELIVSIAKDFPQQKFILFDTELEEGSPNVYAISYKQNEGSYLAGVLAALVTTSDMPNANPEKKIGFVGGMEHPIISDFLVGYIEGAQSVVPDIEVLVSYIGSWDDTAKGKENGVALYNQGVDVIYTAAEQAGLGCVDAAVEMGKYVIGCDSDQGMLFKGVDEKKANAILTSAVKRVDESLLYAIQKYIANTLKFGTYESLGIAEKVTGLADNEYYEKNVSQAIRDQVKQAEANVLDGKVKVTSALGLSQEEIQKIVDSAKK